MTKSALIPALYLPADGIKIGDTGFAKTPGKVGHLIRFGEWLKWRKDQWNHVFIVTATDGTPEGTTIAQATPGKGMILSPLSSVSGTGIVCIVHPADGVDAAKVAFFAGRQVGDKYGFGSDICIALDIITPDWFPGVRRNGTWECAAVSAEANRFGGWYLNWGDIYMPAPQQVWDVWPISKKAHFPS